MKQKNLNFKKVMAIALVTLLTFSTFMGCSTVGSQGDNGKDVVDMSAVNNTTSMFAGVDDLGRTIDLYVNGDDSKEVGLFYFLWTGSHGTDKVYDVTKVLENNPNAADDNLSWIKAGGGPAGAVHWWGESLFGHFFASDEWVLERDVQMLTDAGVDFLVFDCSNAVAYTDAMLALLKVLDKYYQQGFEVPQVTAITMASSGATVMSIYEDVYMKYPQYGHLWYQMNGKPLMIGSEMDPALSDECIDFYTFLTPQWPREPYHTNGFPWMDFGYWTEDGTQAVFGEDGSKTIMSVSVAQHKGTLAWSSSAFYGDTTNHTRSWHDGSNDTAEDAYLYGYNFAEQFEYAIEKNPDIIFITGWNEWIAGRQKTWSDINGDYLTDPVILVDAADINDSRDIQPMKGGYGDNYYMQMVSYIRKFKGASVNNIALNTSAKVKPISIDVKKDTSQWDNVDAYYLDYINDTNDRRAVGYGGKIYRDETGRNDIYKMKLANDSENLYAFVQTMDVIEGMDQDHCLSMFINTGNEKNDTWCGYDFVVSRTAATKDGLVVEKRTATGWKQVGVAPYSQKNNELQFAIPLSMLGLDKGDVSIEFKFADNYQGEDDIFSFYCNGDAAPYGRLNYVYDSKGIENFDKFVINENKAVPNSVQGFKKVQ